MKKVLTVFLVIIIILFLFYASKWYMYIYALDEQSGKWYKEEYVEKEFKGKVKYIQMFDDNPYKIILSLDNEGEFDINYGVTCVDKEFIDFVEIGDSVFKRSEEKVIKFTKEDKKSKIFELNFCGKFK